MSSQGSSGVRTCSGAAFTSMSGDLLSKEVSTPSASSTKSTPEVASRPTSRMTIEPVREIASTSGRPREEEEDKVAVNYEDL